jgi:hypothetical protein
MAVAATAMDMAVMGMVVTAIMAAMRVAELTAEVALIRATAARIAA